MERKASKIIPAFLFLGLFILSACSAGLSKKDDPVEQTKNYVVGLKADQVRAQIMAAQDEYRQLEQMISAFGPVGDNGENYLEKASTTKKRIEDLKKELEKINEIKK